MLEQAYLVAVVIPLALTIVGIGVRVARFIIATGPAPTMAAAFAAPALELVGPPDARPGAVEPGLRARPAEIRETEPVAAGALQLVAEGGEPSTKVCPDCAETILYSARVCRHCRFRFEPALQGSAAM